MNRVKKQLHEWDENLKDDSLPTNAVGQPLFYVLQMESRRVRTCARTSLCLRFCAPVLSFLSSLSLPFCLVCVRLFLQSSGLSAHRRRSAAPTAEDRQCHPETSLWAGHHGPGKEGSPPTPHYCPFLLWLCSHPVPHCLIRLAVPTVLLSLFPLVFFGISTMPVRGCFAAIFQSKLGHHNVNCS